MLIKTNLDFENTARLLNLPDPQNSGDAANRGWVNAQLAAISGTLTDAISVSNLDCTSNPNYPASNAGVKYVVTGAGLVGGNSGVTVNIGDVIFCRQTTVSGDHATVGANFFILESNRDAATQTTAGVIRVATQNEVLNDSSALVAVTPSTLAAKLAAFTANSFGTLIGNNSATTFTIAHNLNSAYPVVAVYEATGKNLVIADVQIIDSNNVRVTFTTAPATNSFFVKILK